MEWASVPEVRKKAGVSEEDYTDVEIQEFISWATKEVNSKIITRYIRERIGFIDSYRSNKIDGSNTTYFVRNWLGKYLADSNFDNSIDVSDIKVVKLDRSTNTESEVVVSSINPKSCSFVLSEAPSNCELYVDYCVTSVDPITPDSFLWQCTTYLAAGTSLVGNDGFDVKFDNVSIKPGKDGGKGKQLLGEYERLLDQLLVNLNGGTAYGDMAEKI